MNVKLGTLVLSQGLDLWRAVLYFTSAFLKVYIWLCIRMSAALFTLHDTKQNYYPNLTYLPKVISLNYFILFHYHWETLFTHYCFFSVVHCTCEIYTGQAKSSYTLHLWYTLLYIVMGTLLVLLGWYGVTHNIESGNVQHWLATMFTGPDTYGLLLHAIVKDTFFGEEAPHIGWIEGIHHTSIYGHWC